MKHLFAKSNLVLLLATYLVVAPTLHADPQTNVWFAKPGKSFIESSVVGNGRLGAMDPGGVGNDRIVLNESSMWSGGPYEANNYNAWKCLPEVRNKLFAGDIAGADRILGREFQYGRGVKGWWDDKQFGCYQILADLTLAFEGHPNGESGVSNYRRQLNLMTGLATTQYEKEGVTFTRELVASKPDEVIAIRVKADRPGALSFTASLSRQFNASTKSEGGFHELEGRLQFNKPGKGIIDGTRFLALLGAKAKGGTVTAADSGLKITGADEVTLFVSAGTSLFDSSYETTARQRIDAAMKRTFDELRDQAVADHASFMNRCQLHLPAGLNAELPTPERVKLNSKNPDPSLAALFFQFGRHLMVCGSRPDSQLPTNLQGIWAAEYSTPWRGDFHSNINLQMNYWPAEVTNLSGCHLPLLRFLQGVAKEGAKTAQAYYNAPGWMANHTQNPWFETAPSYMKACIGPACGAWLAQHLWMHYQFTCDKEFLRANYPMLRGAAEFCVAALVEEPKHHWLVTAPSNSPENAYFYNDQAGKKQKSTLCIGATYDMQIMRGLFTATAEAARILGTDEEFAKKLDATRARLAPTRVNSAGRIMEWLEDYEETEVHHRHCSHLWGLYPGTEINPNTPELYKGARLSLDQRGDISTGWSMAWKANFRARLHDGDRANTLLALLIANSAPNLFDMCPPFQIDGNFGGCAAVAEMLLQSHAGAITPLPALPKAWDSGSFNGLRARGAFTVSAAWAKGDLTKLQITSDLGGPCKVEIGPKWKVYAGNGQEIASTYEAATGRLVFQSRKGETYDFRPVK